MKEYKLNAPKIFRGDRVRFLDHRGNLKNGECSWIETHYSLGDNKPYHIYSILPDGGRRMIHVGCKNLLI